MHETRCACADAGRPAPKYVRRVNVYKDGDEEYLRRLKEEHGDLEDLQFWGRAFVDVPDSDIRAKPEFLKGLLVEGLPLFLEHRYSEHTAMPPRGTGQTTELKLTHKPMGHVITGAVKDGVELWILGQIDENKLTREELTLMRTMLRDGTLGSLSVGGCGIMSKEASDAYKSSCCILCRVDEVSLCESGLVAGTDIVNVRASGSFSPSSKIENATADDGMTSTETTDRAEKDQVSKRDGEACATQCERAEKPNGEQPVESRKRERPDDGAGNGDRVREDGSKDDAGRTRAARFEDLEKKIKSIEDKLVEKQAAETRESRSQEPAKTLVDQHAEDEKMPDVKDMSQRLQNLEHELNTAIQREKTRELREKASAMQIDMDAAGIVCDDGNSEALAKMLQAFDKRARLDRETRDHEVRSVAASNVRRVDDFIGSGAESGFKTSKRRGDDADRGGRPGKRDGAENAATSNLGKRFSRENDEKPDTPSCCYKILKQKLRAAGSQFPHSLFYDERLAEIILQDS